ncbi:hypothetical protein NPIL_33571 [Nephila pilipes]|uniref:Uncharacterized protein n=1 Tax=Nephila pilipes TaxID=299642 RepID=A0A8X6Q924_NEPPI|nr:hypothetical protein NPIL_33571 [Nephila pilipes]
MTSYLLHATWQFVVVRTSSFSEPQFTGQSSIQCWNSSHPNPPSQCFIVRTGQPSQSPYKRNQCRSSFKGTPRGGMDPLFCQSTNFRGIDEYQKD